MDKKTYIVATLLASFLLGVPFFLWITKELWRALILATCMWLLALPAVEFEAEEDKEDT